VGWPHELGELHQKVFREVLVGDIWDEIKGTKRDCSVRILLQGPLDPPFSLCRIGVYISVVVSKKSE
jgi:hypothetical protein